MSWVGGADCGEAASGWGSGGDCAVVFNITVQGRFFLRYIFVQAYSTVTNMLGVHVFLEK